MPGTLGAGGNILYNFLVMLNITPVSVGAAITAEQNFSVPGLQVTDFVDVQSYAAQTAGIGIANARCSAAGILTIGFSNSTAGALTPVAGQYFMEVARPESFTTLPVNAL
jgi:hypothetical protein